MQTVDSVLIRDEMLGMWAAFARSSEFRKRLEEFFYLITGFQYPSFSKRVTASMLQHLFSISKSLKCWKNRLSGTKKYNSSFRPTIGVVTLPPVCDFRRKHDDVSIRRAAA